MAGRGKTKAQLIEENERLQGLVAELKAADAARNQAEEELRERTKQLAERVKKLHFLHRLVGITLTPGVSLEGILQRIVELLPTGWQYPDITCARITLNGLEFTTPGFRETAYRQGADVVIRDERAGAVEVFYLEETPEADEGPFLSAERRLLEAVAGRIRQAAEHMYAAEALQDSEEKYRRLFERLNDAAFVADTESGIILDANAQAEVLLGRTRQEIIGAHHLALHLSGRADRYREKFAEHVRKGSVADYDGEVVRKDGTIVPVLISAATMTIRGKRVILGLFRDITELKLAEEALRASENKYEVLVDNLPQRIFRKDRHLVYVSCNRSYAGDLGIEPDAIVGMTDYDFYPKELADKYRADDRRVMESGEAEEIEESYVKDGQEMNVHTVKTPLTDDNGDSIGVLGIFWDVSDRKRAEEALRESEERYRSLYNSSRDGIAFFDMHGNYVDANPALAGMLGYTLEELKGMTWEDMTPRKWHQLTADIVNNQVLTRGFSDEYEKEYLRKDGTLVPVANKAWVIKDEQGNPTGMWGTIRDISERKRVEQELIAYHERLRSLVSELSRVEERERWELADRLHDSVAPLLTISTMRLGRLKESVTSDGWAAEIEDIGKLLDEAIRTVRSVTYELCPPVLHELGLRPAVASLAEQFGRLHGIAVEVDDDGQPESLDRNARAFAFRAVRELLFNVAKHARARHACVSIRKDRDFVRIEVQDDGVGFDASGEGVFAEGERAFGLFNIRERLDQLGGRLEVESSPGRGTHVTMLVPAEIEMRAGEGEGPCP